METTRANASTDGRSELDGHSVSGTDAAAIPCAAIMEMRLRSRGWDKLETRHRLLANETVYELHHVEVRFSDGQK